MFIKSKQARRGFPAKPLPVVVCVSCALPALGLRGQAELRTRAVAIPAALADDGESPAVGAEADSGSSSLAFPSPVCLNCQAQGWESGGGCWFKCCRNHWELGPAVNLSNLFFFFLVACLETSDTRQVPRRQTEGI